MCSRPKAPAAVVAVPSAYPAVLEPVASLLGTWTGEGRGFYPTVSPFDFTEETTFTHFSKPFLFYSQKTWNKRDGSLMHVETGYVRVTAANGIEFVVSDPTGVSQAYAGTVQPIENGVQIILKTTSVSSTPAAKEVQSLTRTWTITENNMNVSLHLQAVGQELQEHIVSSLNRDIIPTSTKTLVPAEPAVHGPTTDKIKEYWTAFGPKYADLHEREMITVTRSLLTTLGLERLENGHVLEVACGSGRAALELNLLLPASSHLTAVDLSPSMVSQARERLPATVHVQQADAEHLPFADQTFDAVYSNLCLQLVADPEQMISELFRVIKPGARVACSVWGRKEHSPKFAIIPTVIAENGLPPFADSRSNFHLNDVATTSDIFRKHGFQSILHFYQPTATAVVDGAYFAQYMTTPTLQTYLSFLTQEQRELFTSKVVQKANETLAAGTPLSLETLVFVAQKPASQ